MGFLPDVWQALLAASPVTGRSARLARGALCRFPLGIPGPDVPSAKDALSPVSADDRAGPEIDTWVRRRTVRSFETRGTRWRTQAQGILQRCSLALLAEPRLSRLNRAVHGLLSASSPANLQQKRLVFLKSLRRETFNPQDPCVEPATLSAPRSAAANSRS